MGTSALRRAAQLHALRDDLEVADLRGNVDTRLRRLAEGDYDAIVLALAGLQRLGRDGRGGRDARRARPRGRAGRARADRADRDDRARAAAAAISDAATMTCLRAERAVVRDLEADCATPVGAHAAPVGGRAGPRAARLRGPRGRRGLGARRPRRRAADPEAMGAEVARRLRAAGADEVLGRGAGAAR